MFSLICFGVLLPGNEIHPFWIIHFIAICDDVFPYFFPRLAVSIIRYPNSEAISTAVKQVSPFRGKVPKPIAGYYMRSIWHMPSGKTSIGVE